MRGQHTGRPTLAHADRHADEGQFPIVQLQPVQKAGIVGNPTQHDRFAAFQNAPDDALPRLVTDFLALLQILTVDRADQQLAALWIQQGDHAPMQTAVLMQHLQQRL